MARGDKGFRAKKEASARAAKKDAEAQAALRKKQEGKNPGKLSREELKLAKRMPGGRPGDRD